MNDDVIYHLVSSPKASIGANPETVTYSFPLLVSITSHHCIDLNADRIHLDCCVLLLLLVSVSLLLFSAAAAAAAVDDENNQWDYILLSILCCRVRSRSWLLLLLRGFWRRFSILYCSCAIKADGRPTDRPTD